jgi:SAM-dependent methyltransferase
VDWHIVQSSDLPVSDGSIDVVTSLSVIEHQPDKVRAVDEVARVLRPGGLFALSFDLAEPDLGMTYPSWNGEALTRAKFETLLGHHAALELTTPLDWNHEDIAAFAAWHRQTAPHHTYVTVPRCFDASPPAGPRFAASTSCVFSSQSPIHSVIN